MADFVPIISSLLLCYVFVYLVRYIYRDLTTPLRIRDLPGPSNPSFAHGNYQRMAANIQQGDPEMTNKWRDAFGRTFQFRGLFSIRELHTSDPKALTHIAFNLPIYQKLPATRYNLARLLGEGKITVHCNLSHFKPLIPAFSAKSMRALTPVFVYHANRLRDLWSAPQVSNERHIDVLSWLRRAALDSIGEAGLNYQFNSLAGGEPSELIKALTQLLHASGSKSRFINRIAQASFPMLRFLPLLGNEDTTGPRETLLKIGSELLAERKAALAGAVNGDAPRDMLSCIITANNALPINDRLSNDVLIAQVPTLVVVGHENTSAAVAWALHRLATHPDIQERLRAELLSVHSDSPTYDELNSLPYLENIIKETTRLDPSVEFTSRVAAVDDLLPLSEPFVDTKGRMHAFIPVPRGQKIHIPIRALNIDKSLWGEDANLFKPERWDKLPEAVRANPSVYGHLFSFYAGGHSCIGHRYAVMEQKALLFSLIRSFEFQNALPPDAIGRTSGTSLSRPIVLSQREKGTQMPLIVRSYKGH
ncbi:cytochrome P450 [Mycena leptocephala]|nr:cytochrome P450 [Mycena leptocephala]